MVNTYSLKANKKLSTNFKVSEFACHNGADTVKVDSSLVELLQKIRDHFGKPVHITSGYRTAAYNKSVGGATNSYHVKGQAADITVSDVSNKEVAKYAESIGCKGVGLYNYPGGFVHVDTRSTKYLWQQDSKNASYYQVSTHGAPAYTNTSYKVKVTAKSGLNVRNGAGANYPKASGALSYNKVVTVTKEQGNWGYIGTGWICLDYTSKC